MSKVSRFLPGSQLDYVLPCVVLGFSGCHRYEAHQRLGLPTIRCKIRRGTKETLRFFFFCPLYHQWSNFFTCITCRGKSYKFPFTSCRHHLRWHLAVAILDNRFMWARGRVAANNNHMVLSSSRYTNLYPWCCLLLITYGRLSATKICK